MILVGGLFITRTVTMDKARRDRHGFQSLSVGNLGRKSFS